MFLHYRRTGEQAENDAESHARELRYAHHQAQIFALCPTDAEIVAGCGGQDGSDAESVRDMLDTYASFHKYD
jgi:hypothetical protein